MEGRFGEMEVWALKHMVLIPFREMLTVNRTTFGRTKVYEAVVRGDDNLGIPESFNVLIKELRSLGLNVDLDQREL